MKDEIKEKRCILCGKLLIREKVSFCRHCKLEVLDKAKIVPLVGTIGILVASFWAKAFAHDGETDESNSDEIQ